MGREITVLTDEQKALMPQYVEEWTRIGLSINPEDRLEAEVGLRQAYEAAGLLPPEHVIWVSTVLDALPEVEKLGPVMGGGAWTGKLSGILHDVDNRIERSITSEKDYIYDDDDWDLNEFLSTDSLLNYLQVNIREKVRANLSAHRVSWEDPEVLLRIPQQQRSILGKIKGNIVHVTRMAPSLSFFAYCRDVLGLTKETEQLTGLELVMRSTRWVMMYGKLAILGERSHGTGDVDGKEEAFGT